MSASWPVAGDGLRRGAGESAECPISVKEVIAMFALHLQQFDGLLVRTLDRLQRQVLIDFEALLGDRQRTV
jgi:hypothetical protein